EILEQTLDVIELELRAIALAETLAQLFEDAARALHVDLARHLHGRIVAVVAPAHRAAERVRVVLRARAAASRLAARTGAVAVILHRLRKILRALAHSLQGLALAVHRIIGVALAELIFRVAHLLVRIAELVHFVVAVALLVLLPRLLLARRQTMLFKLIEQALETLV